MLVPAAPSKADVPLTASRAVRLAMTRAAEESIGLSVSVEGIAEEAATLDELVRSLVPEFGLIALTRPGDGPPSQEDALVGLAALDPQLASAVLELQTMGRLRSETPEERVLTSADLALAHPLLARFFLELAETTPRTSLDGWTDRITIGGRIESPRAVGLCLPDTSYRVMRIGLDLGVPDRQGEMWIILPGPRTSIADSAGPVSQADWRERLDSAVMSAPAALRAVLHRFDMSLAAAEALREGQVIPLTGCTVGSVQLEGPTGERVAKGRLGQVSGHIAVRIQEPEVQMMEALTTPGRPLPALSSSLLEASEASNLDGALMGESSMTDVASGFDDSDGMAIAPQDSALTEQTLPDPGGLPDAELAEATPVDAMTPDLPEVEAAPLAMDVGSEAEVEFGEAMSTGNFGLTDED